jgi:hypothetical protein
MKDREDEKASDDLLESQRELATAFDVRESEIERARIELILRPLTGPHQPLHDAT